jgi:hypothetical protein
MSSDVDDDADELLGSASELSSSMAITMFGAAVLIMRSNVRPSVGLAGDAPESLIRYFLGSGFFRYFSLSK